MAFIGEPWPTNKTGNRSNENLFPPDKIMRPALAGYWIVEETPRMLVAAYSRSVLSGL
jgi:hypothetical protein